MIPGEREVNWFGQICWILEEKFAKNHKNYRTILINENPWNKKKKTKNKRLSRPCIYELQQWKVWLKDYEGIYRSLRILCFTPLCLKPLIQKPLIQIFWTTYTNLCPYHESLVLIKSSCICNYNDCNCKWS